MILGIDVSTSCTGFAIVDNSGKLIECSFCYLSDYDNIFDKATRVKKEIEYYKEKYSIEKVGIEENLSGFRRGLSSAHTIVTLARFNGIVCYLSSEKFLYHPDIIPVSDARRSLGIRSAKKGEDAKEIVRIWVETQEKDYPWQTKVMKSGPRKGEIVREKGVEDCMDAYVIARACLKLKMQS